MAALFKVLRCAHDKDQERNKSSPTFVDRSGSTHGSSVASSVYAIASAMLHLADSFTICDSYFCSVMGPTKPNRLYLWSGTIDAAGNAGGPVTDNSKNGFGWTTYPERLQSAGVSWKETRRKRGRQIPGARPPTCAARAMKASRSVQHPRA
jgi:phospholipase C